MNNTQEITPIQIESWKKEHGDVFYAEADGRKAYFRKPSRKDLSYAMTLRDRPLEMTETLLRNTFLGGDTIFLEDTAHMLGCSALVEQMVQVKEVEVGKL